jgi:hypothetical protein
VLVVLLLLLLLVLLLLLLLNRPGRAWHHQLRRSVPLPDKIYVVLLVAIVGCRSGSGTLQHKLRTDRAEAVLNGSSEWTSWKRGARGRPGRVRTQQ